MNKNYDEILAIKLEDSITLKDYLYKLLSTLWSEGESFSSKRPFGNSGWEWEIYLALVKNNIVKGTLDKYGDLDKFDQEAADKLVFECIDHIFGK